MSTLAEIEAAVASLPPEQLRALLRFVSERVEATSRHFAQTRLAAEWRPPAPMELGAILAPESQWTELCHR